MGRAYSCGLSNAGLVSFGSGGGLGVTRAFYGVSHGRNGVTSLLSCMTVSGRLQGCLQFPAPLVSPAEAKEFTSLLVRLLRAVSA